MTSQHPSELESDLPARLAKPAQRGLAAAGYTRLEQLAGRSESEIKRLHGMGPKAIDQIKSAMSAKGLAFAPEKPREGKS